MSDFLTDDSLMPFGKHRGKKDERCSGVLLGVAQGSRMRQCSGEEIHRGQLESDYDRTP